jgi:hypothetical protein
MTTGMRKMTKVPNTWRRMALSSGRMLVFLVLPLGGINDTVVRCFLIWGKERFIEDGLSEKLPGFPDGYVSTYESGR